MYRHYKFSLYAILLAVATVFISCENEQPFQEYIDSEHTLEASSSIIEMLKHTSSNDGSYDNIVDGASCLGIQFPYTISANGSELTMAAVPDLQEIEDIFDAAEDGERHTEITFPITVVMADHTELPVSSADEFQRLVEQCPEDGKDDDIECIDVTYPIDLFTFDPNLQQTGSLTVKNDRELRRFLAGLIETDLIAIDFPLTFEMFDGVEVTVSSNSELAAAMERAVEICDEDDDNDHNDDDFTKPGLDSLLVACPWSVEAYRQQDLDVSEKYEDYVLVFNADGTLITDDGSGQQTKGIWSVTVSDFKVFLEIKLEDAPEFNGVRYTYEIGDGTLKLDGSDTDAIILDQQCSSEQNVETGSSLRNDP
ncbi:MAG TPA: hypothetical protein VFM69_07065 [Pricia sp.]|nr:hypothetical protein [Pricia sp.]